MTEFKPRSIKIPELQIIDEDKNIKADDVVTSDKVTTNSNTNTNINTNTNGSGNDNSNDNHNDDINITKVTRVRTGNYIAKVNSYNAFLKTRRASVDRFDDNISIGNISDMQVL